MDLFLIPGFWLNASSWDEVVPGLRAAGHRVFPLTLPGMESRDTDRSGIGIDDWLTFVVQKVDAAQGPVVVVGHSAGGALAQGVVDRRPEKVARVVYVDSFPWPSGKPLASGFEVDGSDVPLAAWDAMDEPDLVDMDEEQRARFEARAIPVPARLTTEPLTLHDPRRHDVPATVIICGYPASEVRDWIASGEEWTSELAAMKDTRIVEVRTGHWPQLTRPAELTQAILEAVS